MQVEAGDRAGAESAERGPERAEPNGRAPAKIDRWIRHMLMAASLVTVAVALWLLAVSALVLPVRDPAHVPLWLVVAFVLLGYSALCWAHLLTGSRGGLLRWSVLTASCAAVIGGIYGITAMIRQADAGGHFEGYMILLGLMVGGHGLIAILHTLRTGGASSRQDLTPGGPRPPG